MASRGMSLSKKSFVSTGTKGFKMRKAPKLRGKNTSSNPNELEEVKALFEKEQLSYSPN